MLIRNFTWALFLLLVCGHLNVSSQQPYSWALGNPYASRVDAAFPFSINHAALISGRNIRFEPMVAASGINASEAVLDLSAFPANLASKPVSDAISYDEKTVLIFKGDVYVAFDKQSLQPVSQPTLWAGLPALWNHDFDAALEWSNGNYCFIKGMQYVLYDPKRSAYGTPQMLNRLQSWPSTWIGSIDAAFNGQDGFIYFIRQGQVLAYNAVTLGQALGGPASLSGSNLNAVAPAERQAGNNVSNNPYQGQNSEALQKADPNLGWCAVTSVEKWHGEGGRTKGKWTPCYGGDTATGTKFVVEVPQQARIAEIRVWGHGPIEAIQFVSLSPKGYVTEHEIAGQANGKPEVFRIEQDECLKEIEVTWGGAEGNFIYTLKFRTTDRESKRFGEFQGIKGKYSYTLATLKEDAIAGFKGTSSRYLQSIGIKTMSHSVLSIDRETGMPTDLVSDDEENNAIEDPNKPKDPWFDNHFDIVTKGQMRQMCNPMPMHQWLLKSVNYTRLDIWRPYESLPFPQSPVMLRISNTLGGVLNTWYLPHGWSSRSTWSESAEASEEAQTFTSYHDWAQSSTISAGGNFGIPNVFSVSANTRITKGTYGAIGSTHVTRMYKDAKLFGLAAVDLHWIDGETGKKMRQFLHLDFRSDVAKLPPGQDEFMNVPTIPNEAMKKKVPLPPALESIRPQYQKLIDKWGTHLFTEVRYGGQYIKYINISKEEAESGQVSEVEVNAALEVKSKKAEGGAEGGYSVSNSQETKVTNVKESTHLILTGGGASSEFITWDKDISAHPAIVEYELLSLAELTDTVFFPFDKQILNKQKLLDIFIRQYLIDNDATPANPYESIAIKWKADEAKVPVRLKIKLNSYVVTGTDDDYCSSEDNDLDLKGALHFQVQSGAEVLYTEPNFWVINTKGGHEYGKDSRDNLPFGPKTIETNRETMQKTQLRIYGKLEDYDLSCDNDIYLNETESTALSVPINVSPSPGAMMINKIDIAGRMTINVEVTWEEIK